MTSDSEWTVPDGQHQPGPDATIGQDPLGPQPAFPRLIYDHWGIYKGHWRGRPVLCYNVSVTDHWLGPQPGLDSHTLAVELPVSCPLLTISPATALGSVRRLFRRGGYGHAGFDRRFQVESDDKDFARGILAPATVAWLAEHPVAVTNSFRFDGTLLLMPNAGVMGPPEVTHPKLDFLVELYTRVPARYRTPDT